MCVSPIIVVMVIKRDKFLSDWAQIRAQGTRTAREGGRERGRKGGGERERNYLTGRRAGGGESVCVLCVCVCVAFLLGTHARTGTLTAFPL